VARGLAIPLEHTLPWYFGLALFAVWAACIVGGVVILRRIRASKAARRPELVGRRPRREVPELEP
jgi:hypothetical protein